MLAFELHQNSNMINLKIHSIIEKKCIFILIISLHYIGTIVEKYLPTLQSGFRLNLVQVSSGWHTPQPPIIGTTHLIPQGQARISTVN